MATIQTNLLQSNWTEARVEQLKTLWAEGLSCSQIARKIGGVSRNACIGKLTRLGLTGSGNPARKGNPARIKRSNPMPHVVRVPEPIAEAMPALLYADGKHVTVLTVSDRHCRWPIGDPPDKDFHFCGHSPKSGSPYCEAHARKAYQPQQPHRAQHQNG